MPQQQEVHTGTTPVLCELSEKYSQEKITNTPQTQQKAFTIRTTRFQKITFFRAQKTIQLLIITDTHTKRNYIKDKKRQALQLCRYENKENRIF